MRKTASQEKILCHWRKALFYPCTKRRVIYSNDPLQGHQTVITCYEALGTNAIKED